MKQLFKTFWLALAAVALVACGPKNNEPTPTPPTPDVDPVLTDNSLLCGKIKADLNSFVFDYETNAPLIAMYASPTKGIETLEAMKAAEYVMIALSPTELNVDLDVMLAEDFMFENTTKLCPEVTALEPGATDQVSAGTIKVALEEATGKVVVEFNFTAKESGAKFQGRIVGQMTPDPDPDPEPVNYDNQLAYNGDEVGVQEFKSVWLAPEGGAVHATKFGFFASPTAEVKNGVAAYSKVPHIKILILASQLRQNAEINLMAPGDADYNFTNGKPTRAIDITSVSTSDFDQITAGTMKFTYDEPTGKYSVSFSLTSKVDGKVLAGNINGVIAPAPPVPDPENVFIWGIQPNEPVVSKYVSVVADKGTTFYLTSTNVLPNNVVTQNLYAKLFVKYDVVNGAELSFASAPEGSFELTYYNKAGLPVDAKAIVYKPGSLNGATGTIKVSKTGNDYEVKVKFGPVNAESAYIHYKGAFLDYSFNNFYTIQTYDPEALTTTITRSVVWDKTTAGKAIFYFSGKTGITTVTAMKEDPAYFSIIMNDANVGGDEISSGYSVDIAGAVFEINGMQNLGYLKAKYDNNVLTIAAEEGNIGEQGPPIIFGSNYVGAVTIVE